MATGKAMGDLPRRFARYGPIDRYFDAPPAGLCLSAFAILRRGRKVLAGRPRFEREWIERFYPSWLAYNKEEQAEFASHLHLPATYLEEGEHPDATLARIMHEQLGVRRFTASAPQIVSYTAESDWYPGHRHWDLAFVYRVKAATPKTFPRGWREIGWLDTEALTSRDFGWNGELLVDLGILKR